MKERLPFILSGTAVLVALLGATPVGRAAEDAIAQVVPRAKKADFAANAGKLNGRKSSVNPRRGQIPVVGEDGKLAISIGAVGPPGAKGEPGPPGASGYQQITTQISLGGKGFRTEQLNCPGGKSVLGGGHFFREQDADELSLTESRPVSDSSWRFKIENQTGDPKGAQSIYIVCASMTP